MAGWGESEDREWARTGGWIDESGSSSSTPSDNSSNWIAVSDLEEYMLTDTSDSWEDEVYLEPRVEIHPNGRINANGDFQQWPMYHSDTEVIVPSTQIIDISSGEPTPNSWEDSPPSVLPEIPMPHVYTPGQGVEPYIPMEINPTDYLYPFLYAGEEPPSQTNEVQDNQEQPNEPIPTWEEHLGLREVPPEEWARRLMEYAQQSLPMEPIPQDRGTMNALWCSMYGEPVPPGDQAAQPQIPDLNQTPEESVGENTGIQSAQGPTVIGGLDQHNLEEGGHVPEEGRESTTRRMGRPPRRLARMRTPTPSEVTLPCEQCGRTGHFGHACPNMRYRQQRIERQNICLTCGERGHYSAFCPRNLPSSSHGPPPSAPQGRPGRRENRRDRK